jgi:hypothetical protein
MMPYNRDVKRIGEHDLKHFEIVGLAAASARKRDRAAAAWPDASLEIS